MKRTLIGFVLGVIMTIAGMTIAQEATPEMTLEPCERHVVTVTVHYLQRIAIPENAHVTVRLVDVSLMDVPAVLLTEMTVGANGAQVPFTFEIPYSPDALQAGHTYAVQAQITVGDELLFVSDTHTPVFGEDNITEVELVLAQA